MIIIEHGYLDNHIDYERLGTREDWERMGRLDAAGYHDDREQEETLLTVLGVSLWAAVLPWTLQRLCG